MNTYNRNLLNKDYYVQHKALPEYNANPISIPLQPVYNKSYSKLTLSFKPDVSRRYDDFVDYKNFNCRKHVYNLIHTNPILKESQNIINRYNTNKLIKLHHERAFDLFYYHMEVLPKYISPNVLHHNVQVKRFDDTNQASYTYHTYSPYNVLLENSEETSIELKIHVDCEYVPEYTENDNAGTLHYTISITPLQGKKAFPKVRVHADEIDLHSHYARDVDLSFRLTHNVLDIQIFCNYLHPILSACDLSLVSKNDKGDYLIG